MGEDSPDETAEGGISVGEDSPLQEASPGALSTGVGVSLRRTLHEEIPGEDLTITEEQVQEVPVLIKKINLQFVSHNLL